MAGAQESRFVDLSHTLADGQSGVRLKVTRTRAQSRAMLGSDAAFEATEIGFPTAVGTYLDAPYCRWPERADIAGLPLGDLILPGVVVDCRGRPPGSALGPEALPPEEALAGRAVLLHFGWDAHWGTDAYARHPHVDAGAVERLLAAGARLLGVDAGNVDGPGDAAYPVHSRLLAADVLVVENLTGLGRLLGRPFRFFAVPVKAVGATSMTVRAFAELN